MNDKTIIRIERRKFIVSDLIFNYVGQHHISISCIYLEYIFALILILKYNENGGALLIHRPAIYTMSQDIYNFTNII